MELIKIFPKNVQDVFDSFGQPQKGKVIHIKHSDKPRRLNIKETNTFHKKKRLLST